MCGIFGVVARGHEALNLDRERAEQAGLMLGHRGPDGFGVDQHRRAFFCHNRLSIVDQHSRSNQPMLTDDRRLMLVFNGEIYNYQALRDELSGFGFRFRTRSDTEVVLNGYRRWGKDLTQHLSGDYAMAISDEVSGKFFACRDVNGVKPLYYALTADSLVFGSSPVPIAFYLRSAELDEGSIHTFLTYRTTVGEQTLLRDVRRLRPGHRLMVREQGVALEAFGSSLDAFDCSHGRFEREKITAALARQQVHDEPIALLLSGGVDSSVLAYEFSRLAPARTTCYIARVPDARYDESGYALEVARALSLPCQTVDVAPLPDLDALAGLVKRRHGPVAMHNEFAMDQLMRAVSVNNKVVFTGEGADELFYGYSRLFRLAFDWMRASWLRGVAPPAKHWLAARLKIDLACQSPLDMFLSRYGYFPYAELAPLLTSAYREQVAADHSVRTELSAIMNRLEGQSLTRQVAGVFLAFHLPALLDMVDGVSMANGVEARVPFLDDAVVRMACRLHDREKLRWKSPVHQMMAIGQPIAHFSERHDVSKWCLKSAYAHCLPRRVVTRRKMGFPVPLMRWSGSEFVQDFLSDLAAGRRPLSPYLRGARLLQWLRHNLAQPDYSFALRVWLIVNLDLFLATLPSWIGDGASLGRDAG